MFWKRQRLARIAKALRDELLSTPGAPLSPALQEVLELLRTRPPLPGAAAPLPPPPTREPSPSELLEALPDAAGIVGPTGKFTLANHALEQLADGRALGCTALETTRSAELAAAVKEALTGKPMRLELTLPAAQRTVLAQITPLSHQGALVLLRDMTEAKRVETARRDFVANASHELRTPVAAISAAIETLLEGAIPMPSEARGFLEMISRHSRRLSRLTQDLLDLSKLESGHWKVELAPHDVSAIARSSIEAIRSRAEERKVAISSEVPQGLLALCDRRALEEVLVNLLENGVKYTPAGGRVRLEGIRDGGAVMLTVSDTGPGIEPRHLPRVFERFYRVDTGRSRDTGGTGLGLAIAKHLMQAQGGEIGVESSPQGTRFSVRLPAA